MNIDLNPIVKITTKRHYHAYLYQRSSRGKIYTTHPDTLKNIKILIETVSYCGTTYEIVGVMDIQIDEKPFHIGFLAGRIEIFIRSREIYQRTDYLILDLNLPYEVLEDRYRIQSDCSDEDKFHRFCYQFLERLSMQERDVSYINNVILLRDDTTINEHLRGMGLSGNRYQCLYHFERLREQAERNSENLSYQRLFALAIRRMCRHDYGMISSLQELANRYQEDEFIQGSYCAELKNLSFIHDDASETYFPLYIEQLERYQESYGVQDCHWNYSLNKMCTGLGRAYTEGRSSEEDQMKYLNRCKVLEMKYPEDYRLHADILYELKSFQSNESPKAIKNHVLELQEKVKEMENSNIYYELMTYYQCRNL